MSVEQDLLVSTVSLCREARTAADQGDFSGADSRTNVVRAGLALQGALRTDFSTASSPYDLQTHNLIDATKLYVEEAKQ